MSEALAVDPTTTQQGASELRVDPGRYITFRLAEELYGIPVGDVREIIEPVDITTLPGSMHSLLGVINLRGRVIPVVDIKSHFGMGSLERTDLTVFIVLRMAGRTFGIVVDEVVEVRQFGEDDLKPPPGCLESEHLVGTARTGEDQVLFLLDLERLLGPPPGGDA